MKTKWFGANYLWYLKLFNNCVSSTHSECGSPSYFSKTYVEVYLAAITKTNFKDAVNDGFPQQNDVAGGSSADNWIVTKQNTNGT